MTDLSDKEIRELIQSKRPEIDTILRSAIEPFYLSVIADRYCTPAERIVHAEEIAQGNFAFLFNNSDRTYAIVSEWLANADSATLKGIITTYPGYFVDVYASSPEESPPVQAYTGSLSADPPPPPKKGSESQTQDENKTRKKPDPRIANIPLPHLTQFNRREVLARAVVLGKCDLTLGPRIARHFVRNVIRKLSLGKNDAAYANLLDAIQIDPLCVAAHGLLLAINVKAYIQYPQLRQWLWQAASAVVTETPLYNPLTMGQEESLNLPPLAPAPLNAQYLPHTSYPDARIAAETAVFPFPSDFERWRYYEIYQNLRRYIAQAAVYTPGLRLLPELGSIEQAMAPRGADSLYDESFPQVEKGKGWYIYMLSVQTGRWCKCYVGITRNIPTRFTGHVYGRAAEDPNSGSRQFRNSVREFSVIKGWTILGIEPTKQLARRREKAIIQILAPIYRDKLLNIEHNKYRRYSVKQSIRLSKTEIADLDKRCRIQSINRVACIRLALLPVLGGRHHLDTRKRILTALKRTIPSKPGAEAKTIVITLYPQDAVYLDQIAKRTNWSRAQVIQRYIRQYLAYDD